MSKRDPHAPNRDSIAGLIKRVEVLEAQIKALAPAPAAAVKAAKPPVVKRDKRGK